MRTIQRLESEVDIPASRTKNPVKIPLVLEDAGVVFIDQNEESGPEVSG